MDVTDTVRTGRCSPEFLSKVLKFKVYIGTIQPGADFPSGGPPQDVGPSDGTGERIPKRPGAEIFGLYCNPVVA